MSNKPPIAWASAVAISHILILRDLANGTEYLDQTPVAYSFKDAVRDLADAQIPMGFELSRVECVDRAAGRITDVTANALNEVARNLEANNEPAGSFSRRLLSACEAYSVALPELDDEGSVSMPASFAAPIGAAPAWRITSGRRPDMPATLIVGGLVLALIAVLTTVAVAKAVTGFELDDQDQQERDR